jgi:Zn-dependent membrane protease YugP
MAKSMSLVVPPLVRSHAAEAFWQHTIGHALHAVFDEAALVLRLSLTQLTRIHSTASSSDAQTSTACLLLCD